jgi:hypothetical protein
MAANYWQLPLAGNFPFHFERPLPIPQRQIPGMDQEAQRNAYLQTQFELSQATGGPDPYAHVEFDGSADDNRFHKILLNALQAFQKGSTFAFKLVLSFLSRLIYCLFKLPFNKICAFLVSIDWWLVFAFFAAILISPMTSTEWSGNENGPAHFELILEYELVENFRRWGMNERIAQVPWRELLTSLSRTVLLSSIKMIPALLDGRIEASRPIKYHTSRRYFVPYCI